MCSLYQQAKKQGAGAHLMMDALVPKAMFVAVPGSPRPVVSRVARAVFATTWAGQSIACSGHHTEHHGQNFGKTKENVNRPSKRMEEVLFIGDPEDPILSENMYSFPSKKDQKSRRECGALLGVFAKLEKRKLAVLGPKKKQRRFSRGNAFEGLRSVEGDLASP